jgi:hypothetical protein
LTEGVANVPVGQDLHRNACLLDQSLRDRASGSTALSAGSRPRDPSD